MILDDEIKHILQGSLAAPLSTGERILAYGSALSLNRDEFYTALLGYAFERISELEKSLEQFRADAYRDFEYHNER